MHSFFNFLLALLVFISAVALVVTRHETRLAFAEWQSLQEKRDALNVEWGRLQLEQSTWGRPERVERLAVERLNMKVPGTAETVPIRP